MAAGLLNKFIDRSSNAWYPSTTESWKTSRTAALLVTYFEEPYVLEYEPMMVIYEEPYTVTHDVGTFFELPYAALIGVSFLESYGDIAVLSAVFNEYYGDAGTPSQRFVLPYGDIREVHASHSLPWDIIGVVKTLFVEPYAVTQTSLIATFEELYELETLNKVVGVWQLPYHVLEGEVLSSTPETTVVIDSGSGGQNSSSPDGDAAAVGIQLLDFVAVSVKAGRGQYCISCDVTLPNEEQYAWCNYLDDVTVNLGGTEFAMFVEGKNITISHGQVSYNIGLLSHTAKLDAPYSDTIVDNLDDGVMAMALVQTMAALKNITVDWQIYDWRSGGVAILDWMIPGYAISINDETPLAVIKKVVNAVGGIVQTKPNSDMLIISKYPYPVPQWQYITPLITYSTRTDIKSFSELLEVKDGYNAFQITDQGSSSASINLVVEDGEDTKKIVKGYQVPFNDDNPFSLVTSGQPNITIDRYTNPITIQIPIQEEEGDPEWEIVEFIDHTGSTSLPIYGIVDFEWITEDLGDVADLGAFQISEDGTLSVINTESVPGESLLRIKYLTKFWQWTVDGPDDRPVQFYVPEVEEVS